VTAGIGRRNRSIKSRVDELITIVGQGQLRLGVSGFSGSVQPMAR